jgi:hypothetical protein
MSLFLGNLWLRIGYMQAVGGTTDSSPGQFLPQFMGTIGGERWGFPQLTPTWAVKPGWHYARLWVALKISHTVGTATGSRCTPYPRC